MEEQKERQALRALIAGVSPGRENALVFGEGPKNPKLMLIGEAPGEQESLMGRPFVGKAGKNLDHFLALVGLVRGEIYITNVVKFRPTKTGATGRLSNRPPTREMNHAAMDVHSRMSVTDSMVMTMLYSRDLRNG